MVPETASDTPLPAPAGGRPPFSERVRVLRGDVLLRTKTLIGGAVTDEGTLPCAFGWEALLVKKRIIGATLLTVVCALLISNVVGILMFRSREMDAARETLQELLTLMDAQSAITEPEELLRQFSQAAPDKRLTIIDTDGTVLADSEADVSAMEDHEDRPEVMEAEATGWGEAVRQSDTVGTSMLYVAKRFADHDRTGPCPCPPLTA